MITAAAGASLALYLLFWIVDLVVWLLAMGRIAWRDNITWKYGWWSRLAWIVIASIITWTPAPGLVLPIGSLAAIYRTRSRPRPAEPDPVPFAAGDPDSPREDAADSDGGERR